jgi:hypothetical protein
MDVRRTLRCPPATAFQVARGARGGDARMQSVHRADETRDSRVEQEDLRAQLEAGEARRDGHTACFRQPLPGAPMDRALLFPSARCEA